MKKYLIVLLFFITGSLNSFADNYPRNHDINILHYTFNLRLSDTTNEIFGIADIKIKFKKTHTKSFSLDLIGNRNDSISKGMKVKSVTVKTDSLKFLHKDDRLKIFLKAPSKQNEIINFKIVYSGIPRDGLIISKNKFGERTFFGDNWPNRAHDWLPCIDHPYDKATCDFKVTAPSKYQVIANGILIDKTDIGKGYRKTHWREDFPIATKIMVIGVAEFAVQYLHQLKCLPVESWVYPKDKEKGFYDFSPAPKIIEYFEKLIGPFPFKKLANVESTTIYEGMENASNIFYNEKSITGTRADEVTMSHEIAHQWFGDAVTEEDWNHIWLSEGFATFFQHVFIKHQFGEDSLINIIKQNRRQILAYNYYNPNSAIVDTNISDLNKLLNINTYFKGAYVLRMLRHILGEKKFWKGIKFYYKTYRNKNVLTSDFEKAMEHVYGKKLKWFFDEWIYKPGIPVILGNWHYNKKQKVLNVKLEQVQRLGNIFRMSIDLVIYSDKNSKPKIERLNITKQKNIFDFHFNQKPDSVKLDPGLWVLMQSEFSEK